MAVIKNNTARLLVGLTVKGKPVPRWIPGRNPLDPDYWSAVKNSSVIRAWLSGPKPMIEVDLDADMPDPATPPTAAELEAFTPDELRGAMKDPAVPPAWYPAIEAEISKRDKARIEKRTPAAPPPPRESVRGIRVEEALPMIEAETSVDKLVAWADADKRKTINEAIDKRIAELEGTPDGD